MPEIAIYDATLRDGAQGEGINFSVEDKIAIALKLDELGVAYVEGGFPFSNEKDIAFFKQIRKRPLKTARVVAFGSTRRAKLTVEEDPGLAALLSAGTKAVAVVGKSWDLHVRDVLRTSLEENAAMIADSVRHLKSKGLEVIFDAEHFFDGYRHNPRYALCALQAAREAGADTIVLCDTNGGSLPSHVLAATATVVKEIGGRIGFHGHNDSGMAVANSVTAVEAGATHVQGTINGLGERTGNADLCQVIPNLQLKLQRRCLPGENLKLLTETSRFIYDVANMPLAVSQPFVGRAAFAHKGGLHVDAVRKNPATYEHIEPEEVGNERRLLLSELSGSATTDLTLPRRGDKFRSVSRGFLRVFVSNHGLADMPEIAIYDATLRDGAQGEGINFTVEDKIAIALKLDELGVAYIEGGFPFSNEKDIAFFKQIKKRPLKTARVVAFGSTRRAKLTVEEDPGLAALLAAGTKAVAVVGKSWDLHVRDVLRTSLEENTAMIADSVRHLKSQGPGSDLRRGAFLRRLPAQPAVRVERDSGGARGRRRRHRAVRHERRLAAEPRPGGDGGGREGDRRRASASTATTTRAWRWRTASRRSRRARRTCRGRSTASASAPATPTSAR